MHVKSYLPVVPPSPTILQSKVIDFIFKAINGISSKIHFTPTLYTCLYSRFIKRAVFHHTHQCNMMHSFSCSGVGRFFKAKKNHIITLQTEHKCVLDSCRMMQQEGYYLPHCSPTSLIVHVSVYVCDCTSIHRSPSPMCCNC